MEPWADPEEGRGVVVVGTGSAPEIRTTDSLACNFNLAAYMWFALGQTEELPQALPFGLKQIIPSVQGATVSVQGVGARQCAGLEELFLVSAYPTSHSYSSFSCFLLPYFFFHPSPHLPSILPPSFILPFPILPSPFFLSPILPPYHPSYLSTLTHS